ncbi:MAG TPA: aldose 1-epimerase family protein [Steroidobacteraceae bacterium]|jgi:galactose mutarotase-like enzyme|nr:aldose 1-epimerase family protein [Steroidobacteraceae bacterium]
MADPSGWITIRSTGLSATIDPLGAQLSGLRDADARQLQWQGDPAVWAGRAPLLFPIVGMLAGGQYRSGGRSFSLPRHGFARVRRFAVTDAGPASATFRLSADAQTLAVYPFQFELDVNFAVEGATLSVTSWIRNRGDHDMPASLGYHPAFAWPLPYGQERAAHFIEFEADEPAPIRALDGNGLLSPQRLPTPVENRRLTLRDELFAADALIFDRIVSRTVTYGSEVGPRIALSFPGVPYLGVWTKPGANFICIEPWHGLTDPQGFNGELQDKPGSLIIPPGQVVAIAMALTLLP